jgi:hypothetical protein
MSVLQLQRSDAQNDEKLTLTYQDDWSAMRSAHAEREVFAYEVGSDSGNTYETEVFISDLGTICGYCNCPARVVCRHIKAVLADVCQQRPQFGAETKEKRDN